MSKVTSTIDVLPTSIPESESNFSEYFDLLPRFVVPWDVEFTIQKDVDKPAIPTVPDTVEPVVHYQQHQPVALSEPAPAVTTRSCCCVRQPLFFESAYENCAFLHTLSPDKSDESVALLKNNKCSSEPHPSVFAIESAIYMSVSSDPDMIMLSEALQQPDCHEFIKAMENKLRDHIDLKNWKVFPLIPIPVGKHAITMVWSMKRKRNPFGDILKWKGR